MGQAQVLGNLFSLAFVKVKKMFNPKTSKDVAIVYSGKVIEAFLGLISSVLVARELGPTKLGVLMSLIAFANILGCLMGYGLEVTVVKFIADCRKNKNADIFKVVHTSIAIRLLFIIVASTIIYLCKSLILGKYVKYVASNYIYILAIVLAASNSMFLFCQSIFRGFEQFVKNVITNTAGRLLRLIIILFYLLSGALTVEIVLYANIIAALAVVLLDAIFLNKIAQKFPKVKMTDTCYFKDIFKYSFWMYVAAILVVLFNNMNIMMLNYYSVAMSVGLYAMAENLLRPFEFLPETLNQVFLPKISAIETRDDFYSYMKKIGVLGGVMAACMSPLFLFPETVISIFYGEKYTGGALVLQLLALYLCINIFLNPLYIFAHRLNMPRIFTLSGIIALIVGFIANTQFIPRYGEVGCALTMLTVCIFSKTVILPSIYCKAKRMLPERIL